MSKKIELIQMLEKLEWSEPNTPTYSREKKIQHRCPICHQWKRNGIHEDDCELAKIIRFVKDE
jgi:hypothetical protein